MILNSGLKYSDKGLSLYLSPSPGVLKYGTVEGPVLEPKHITDHLLRLTRPQPMMKGKDDMRELCQTNRSQKRLNRPR